MTRGDFKISWKATYYQEQIIIPSGEINFTQMVEDYGLQDAHRYMQVLIVSALALLCMHAIWRCICITLGIGTNLYEDYEEENGIVNSVHDYTDQTTGMTTRIITQRRKNYSLTTKQKPTKRR